MTGRERLTAGLGKQRTNRPPWSTLVDDHTLSNLPEALRGLDHIGFCRHIACDIFLTRSTSGDIERIGPTLDAIVTPRLREARFVLHPFADGICVPV